MSIRASTITFSRRVLRLDNGWNALSVRVARCMISAWRCLRPSILKTGEAIADVGAGTGLYTGLFSDKVGPQGKVMAVDIVPLFLSRIMDRAKETGRKNIQTVLGSGQSTRLPAASVDKVFICDTYHHFEYPKSMLASIYQALKPMGKSF